MAFTLVFESFPPPDGPLRYAFIPWDSEIYGFPFYTMQCKHVTFDALDRAMAQWFDVLDTTTAALITVRLTPEQVPQGKLLAQYGFYPIETQLAFSQELAQHEGHSEHSQRSQRKTPMLLRQATQADVPVLLDIASRVFVTDRYHLDPHLDPGKADQRYAHWIAQAMEDNEIVYVYEDSDHAAIAGFIHTREQGSNIDLNLVAISQHYQGRGIGKKMGRAVLAAAKERGFTSATTRTSINNPGGINLYTRLGFTLQQSLVIWHRFIEGKTA